MGLPDVDIADNVRLLETVEAVARQTLEAMENLSNTTAVQGYYRECVDQACQAIAEGVGDYGSAIRNSLRRAGEMGLVTRENGTQAVVYASGHTRRVDTAIRQNILDGARQINHHAMEIVGDELGCDGYEVDAHMLCAEDHLPYQGKQFYKGEFERIQESLERPLGQWNCRHTWSPVMMGLSEPRYSQRQLAEMERYSNEPVTIDGVTKSRYRWSQEMRRVETSMRRAKDTGILAKAVGDEELRKQEQIKLMRLRDKYDTIAEKTGITPDYTRTYVEGFKDYKLPKGSGSGNTTGTKGSGDSGNALPKGSGNGNTAGTKGSGDSGNALPNGSGNGNATGTKGSGDNGNALPNGSGNGYGTDTNGSGGTKLYSESSEDKADIECIHSLKIEKNGDIIKPDEMSGMEFEEAVHEYIKSDVCNKSIGVTAQERHFKETEGYARYQEQYTKKKQYGPSYIDLSIEELQRLVDKYAGTGEINSNKKSKWDKVETIFDNDEVIGTVVNNLNGMEAETKIFKIHYSKNGVHIVPDYPNKARRREQEDV